VSLSRLLAKEKKTHSVAGINWLLESALVVENNMAICSSRGYAAIHSTQNLVGSLSAYRYQWGRY